MDENSFIVLQPTVREDHSLSLIDWVVYSLIYGFSQGENGCYWGSLKSMCEMCGVKSKKTIMRSLNSLISKSLIYKSELIDNNVKRCCYSIYVGMVKNTIGMVKDTPEVVQNLPWGMVKNAPNNKEYNKENIRENIKERKFQKPTLQELSEYISSHSYSVDPHNFKDYYDSIGWMVGKKPMKDWQATVRNWHRRHEEERKSSGERKNNTPADILRMMTEK